MNPPYLCLKWGGGGFNFAGNHAWKAEVEVEVPPTSSTSLGGSHWPDPAVWNNEYILSRYFDFFGRYLTAQNWDGNSCLKTIEKCNVDTVCQSKFLHSKLITMLVFHSKSIFLMENNLSKFSAQDASILKILVPTIKRILWGFQNTHSFTEFAWFWYSS